MPDFSHLVQRIHEAASIRLNTRVYDLRRRGVDVVVLSLGEAHFELPALPFDNLPFPQSFHYSHSRGVPELRERLAAYHHERFGVGFDPEREILITAGSKPAILFAMMALLNAGDQVLIPQPAWVSYAAHARLCHARPVMPAPDTSVDDYQYFTGSPTRLIVLSHPTNPTGRILPPSDLHRLHHLAARLDSVLLIDEAYAEFAPEGLFSSAATVDPARDRTVIANSISKVFGLSGWRIGYVIARGDLIDQLLKLNQHCLTCAPTLLQHYVVAHFDRLLAVTRPQIASLLSLRAKVADLLNSLDLACMPGAGTFYFFLGIAPSTLSSTAFCDRLLEEERISAVPGLGYGSSCDSYIRIAIGAEPLSRIEYALRRIKDLIQRTTPLRLTRHCNV
jgi:aspartate aminotransferase/aminotransferase